MAADPSATTRQQSPESRRKHQSNPKAEGASYPPQLTSYSQDPHRSPPHSIEAEMGVLGSMLVSPNDVIAECVIQIGEEYQYFFSPVHATIYMQLVDMWNRQQAIDLITFTQSLRDKNLLEQVGGPAFVTHLFTFVPTAANVRYYLDIIREKFILRKIISICTVSCGRAYDEQDQVDTLLDEVERDVFSISEIRFKGRLPEMKDQVMEAIEAIELLYERKGGITGISTGFAELDRLTSGLHPGEMIVIAARPSMGKTALAMNIAEHVAINGKLPVAVFSLEMSSQQLVQRLLCSRARVNLQKVRDGFLADRDFPSLTAAASKMAEAQIFID
ncbi:MAG TPA: replicative DNA helicase, partial [Chthoniobacterales bacterium]|nr:replicative DNA helicase [Chthoniobacterales bacterium]